MPSAGLSAAPMLQSLQAQSTSQQKSSRVSSKSLDPDNGSDDDDFQVGPAAKKRYVLLVILHAFNVRCGVVTVVNFY